MPCDVGTFAGKGFAQVHKIINLFVIIRIYIVSASLAIQVHLHRRWLKYVQIIIVVVVVVSKYNNLLFVCLFFYRKLVDHVKLVRNYYYFEKKPQNVLCRSSTASWRSNGVHSLQERHIRYWRRW